MKVRLPATSQPMEITRGMTRYIRADLCEKVVAEEYEKQAKQLYAEVGRDVVAQIMATCCTVLNKDYGFGQKRLSDFKQGVECLFKMMLTDGILGKPFTTLNCIEYMRDNFGIDFDNVEVDVENE